MNAKRFFWTTSAVRGLVESLFIGLLLLFLLSLQVSYVSPFVLTNGIFLLCGVCGLWATLRIRLPHGGCLRQATWELLVGASLSIGMSVSILLPARWLGWEEVWTQSTLGGTTLVSLLLLGIGPGYIVARIGVRLWLRWNQLRRQRMRWALTHAQLTVVAGMILFAAVALLVISLLAQPGASSGPSAGVLAAISERLLHTVFPALGLMLLLTVLTLMILLPPSALFSFLVARRTTRRLEALAEAARALREGEYATRLAVVGEDEVAQLQADFNLMAEELERTLRDLQAQRDTVGALLQSRRELVASVSHELRTPITTMRATLESVLSDPGEELPYSLHDDLKVVEGEVLRLQRLVDDLFTLSQRAVNGLAIACRPTNVSPIIQRMVDAQAPLAWEAGRIEVVAELPKDLPQACVDPVRLEQVLANLLRNAIQHTPPGGIVAAAARGQPAGDKPEAIIIEVRDTGEGIPEEDLPRIWDRFYRGESSRSGTGAGLGLALVKELTEAMSGTVTVRSQPGQGSCFTLRYPTA